LTTREKKRERGKRIEGGGRREVELRGEEREVEYRKPDVCCKKLHPFLTFTP
jgi:hypothetical protein